MTEILLPDALAALCRTCETICEKDCCGIGAFNFSPFNIIYHLTRWDARIRDTDVTALRTDLTGLAARLRTLDPTVRQVTLPGLNAILAPDVLLLLIDEISSALTVACALYAREKERIDAGYKKVLQITAPRP